MLLDDMPADIYAQMMAGQKLVGYPALAWRRQVLTVAFVGGDDPLYELVEKTAGEWTSAGGQLRLSFRDSAGRFRRWGAGGDNTAALRIAFDTSRARGGYWSVIGNRAEAIAAEEPTMNLAGFPQKLLPYVNGRNASQWQASYEHSVILHEFGHALGLAHEHFHPACQADLKLPEVVRSLMGPPNSWSEEKARFNMEAAYYFNLFGGRPQISPDVDRASVMLYNLQDSFFRSGAQSPCKPAGGRGFATALSSGDQQFFLASYRTIPRPF